MSTCARDERARLPPDFPEELPVRPFDWLRDARIDDRGAEFPDGFVYFGRTFDDTESEGAWTPWSFQQRAGKWDAYDRAMRAVHSESFLRSLGTDEA